MIINDTLQSLKKSHQQVLIEIKKEYVRLMIDEIKRLDVQLKPYVEVSKYVVSHELKFEPDKYLASDNDEPILDIEFTCHDGVVKKFQLKFDDLQNAGLNFLVKRLALIDHNVEENLKYRKELELTDQKAAELAEYFDTLPVITVFDTGYTLERFDVKHTLKSVAQIAFKSWKDKRELRQHVSLKETIASLEQDETKEWISIDMHQNYVDVKVHHVSRQKYDNSIIQTSLYEYDSSPSYVEHMCDLNDSAICHSYSSTVQFKDRDAVNIDEIITAIEDARAVLRSCTTSVYKRDDL